MLIFDNVSVKRSGRSLFDPISFALKPGQIFTIQGPSGLGKSTLLQALIQPEDSVELSGQVTMDGRAMDPVERLAPCSQTVFQDPLLFSHLSIGANIALSLNRFDQAQRTARITALLEQLGLAGMIAGDPFQLSRGQMMRVSVARALAPHPKVILLDEPFSALDALTRQQVQSALFEQIKTDLGYGILVTHHSEDRPPDGESVCLMPFSSGG
ncbi:MAG: ATP-binding cassette domain-containing protein [Litorivicinaceae bacterium]|jgi:ABC-type uncharacterized transport system YnjBCD ATPase subunit|nr:ATP-binding cassette domain-containing protein [Litorivicinaceae bacterium]